jgi:hypothetical protein
VNQRIPNDETETAAEVAVKWYVPVEEKVMKEPKQIAYFYDAVLADEETELDLDGTVAVPAKGDTRHHIGKSWRVDHVTTDRTAPNALPIYCVYLKEVEN